MALPSTTDILAESQLMREPKTRGLWSDAWRRLARNRMAILGLCIVIAIIVMALFGNRMTPFDPNKQDLDHVAESPSAEHWLGTDQLGRDYFSRIVAGARTALLVGFTVTIISCLLGMLLGAISAYFGGLTDMLISRLSDATMAFPKLLLASFVNATAKPPFQALLAWVASTTGMALLTDTVLADYIVVLVALSLTLWYGYARLVRGEILRLRETDFVLSAQAIGASPWQIITRHLIPNALAPIIIYATAGIGEAMLLEASLSYLGIGIQPPGASWGQMISTSIDQWRYAPHLVAIPGIVLAIAVLGFNLLGDGVNDALDPRRRR
jgi:peptide/nickel transport system permease protein